MVGINSPNIDFTNNDLSKNFDHKKNRVKFVSSILGEKNQNNVRIDLVKEIKIIADGNRAQMEQLYVYSRAHDAFMISETPEQAYNAYLMMNAVKNCMSSFKGLGRVGATSLLMKLVDKKIDTELRKMAVIKSENLLERKNFPHLNVHDNYSDYCQYTVILKKAKR